MFSVYINTDFGKNFKVKLEPILSLNDKKKHAFWLFHKKKTVTGMYGNFSN